MSLLLKQIELLVWPIATHSKVTQTKRNCLFGFLGMSSSYCVPPGHGLGSNAGITVMAGWAAMRFGPTCLSAVDVAARLLLLSSLLLVGIN